MTEAADPLATRKHVHVDRLVAASAVEPRSPSLPRRGPSGARTRGASGRAQRGCLDQLKPESAVQEYDGLVWAVWSGPVAALEPIFTTDHD
jgi:hypothetical protein